MVEQRNAGTRTRRTLTTFSSALALVAAVRAARILVRKVQKKPPRPTTTRDPGPLVDGTSIKLALFPTVLPALYAYLLRIQHLGLARTPFPAQFAELLASPTLLLLPHAWRVQVALYFASAALLHSYRNSRSESGWIRLLPVPPVWTLNVVGNALLLWAFLFRSEAFLRSYEDVILSHSTHYVPPGTSTAALRKTILECTSPGPAPTPTQSSARKDEDEPPRKHEHEHEHVLRHQNALCARLHPDEPSCLKNYARAWVHESLRAGRWVGAFGAVSVVLSAERRGALVRMPVRTLKAWLVSTVRGTAFVVGSINTSWAITCVLQRLLPEGALPRTRWLINGSLASLWILVLPEKRRAEMAMDVARLAALCAWKMWRMGGGVGVPYGEVVLFAPSWMRLVALQRRGERITGVVGMGLERLRSASA
ncbi:hypothetical protein M0805_005556 [Coniferiporia weirii]|nr:hypothetical protein M0805_005556 [Coniferiporia weirii]